MTMKAGPGNMIHSEAEGKNQASGNANEKSLQQFGFTFPKVGSP